ncbi:hypothetical protein V5738_10885 [Salinisphaera sp. SPP-AMP-43]|uniref:hypothetical protein n=1 Tax=Salinisphaera sp. SPP-AMP-43 TaxID=3121288 RepID=UPI003C6E689D
MRGLPRSVEQQGEEAERLHAQMYGQNAQDDDDNRDPENAEGVDGQPDGAATEQPEAEPAAEAGNRESDADYWRRRFETLQGKYNAEVRRVAQENEQLRQKVEQAESRASDLDQKLRDAQQNAPIDVSQHFSQEERDQFGDDTLAMMHRHANAVADERARQVRQEMSGEVEQVRQTQQQSKAEQFVNELTDRVPDWQQVNQDPAFHRWLEEAVPVHTDQGRQQLPRQTLLEQYEQAGNARDVIAMFNEFKEARQGEQRQQQERREAPPKASGGGTPPPSDQGPAWVTQQEIADFYASQSEWMRRDPDACRAREREIERAVQAGRVR